MKMKKQAMDSVCLGSMVLELLESTRRSRNKISVNCLNSAQKQKILLAHKVHSGARAQGMTSSLVFAPNQMISLVDPSFVEEQARRQGQSSVVFNDSGFKTVLNERSM